MNGRKTVLLIGIGAELVLAAFILVIITADVKAGTTTTNKNVLTYGNTETTVTPTPFQPILPAPSSENSTDENASAEHNQFKAVIPTSLPSNPYDLDGIKFDQETSIKILFNPSTGESFSMEFVPIIPNNGPDDYKPGIHKAGVFADESGNVTINPHSGCFIYPEDKDRKYVELEGEYLRQYIEGGGCYDLVSFANVKEKIEALKNSEALVYQNGMELVLRVVDAKVIPFEELGNVKSMSPTELAFLVGTALDKKSVVIITSGWDVTHEPWYSAERLIVILKEE